MRSVSSRSGTLPAKAEARVGNVPEHKKALLMAAGLFYESKLGMT
ncbi:hypothetical protein [Fibrella arboris]